MRQADTEALPGVDDDLPSMLSEAPADREMISLVPSLATIASLAAIG